MPAPPPNNETSNKTQEDHTIPLINASVATTTIAVNAKLDSLFNIMSSPLTGNSDIDIKLDGVRAELEALASTQTTEQEAINKLLEESLNKEVLKHLTKEIQLEIDRCIETTVIGLVEEELEKFIPKEIRNRIDNQRPDIQKIHMQIHNSFIKNPKQFGESLHHLINEKGVKSSLFPRMVKDLLELEEKKVVELVEFYGMETPDMESKIPNLNWFLRKIGITYQFNFFG